MLTLGVLYIILMPVETGRDVDVDGLDLTTVLGGGDTLGFARAHAPRAFEFPADHGPHPDFRTEWWYWTGNLSSESGARYGFQLTFFRSALAADHDAGESVWRTRQIYMAHLAVSDISGKAFHAFERFSRAANGLAGARARPFTVWLEDWRAEATPESADDEVPQIRLTAREAGVGLDLTLAASKPPVLQGVDGLSQKGAQPGNASYYYSLTRLRAEGNIHLPGGVVPVTGSAWMDREWSTSALEASQVGWDWFALQLGDMTEIMYYQIRRRDGSPDPHSAGVFVDPAGGAVPIALSDMNLEVLAHWESPRGGAYPAAWRLRVEAVDLDLTAEPLLGDQEFHGALRYWEGAVRVSGRRDGRPVRGVGYVELTGYVE